MFYEHVENNLVVIKLDCGLEIFCSSERTQQTTGKHAYEDGVLKKTTTIDVNLKIQVVNFCYWHPCSLKVFSGEKQGGQCWRQSSEGRLPCRLGTC